jgi:hypothetical protein
MTKREIRAYIMKHGDGLHAGIPGVPPVGWTDRARQIAKDRNFPNYIRGIAANLMVRGRSRSDVQWLKSELVREFDPDLLRSYATALARVSSLDKNTATLLGKRSPLLKTTLAYLQNRASLPSLVYRGNYVSVR